VAKVVLQQDDDFWPVRRRQARGFGYLPVFLQPRSARRAGRREILPEMADWGLSAEGELSCGVPGEERQAAGPGSTGLCRIAVTGNRSNLPGKAA